MAEKSKKNKTFGHDVGDLILVKWNDGMVYFAKIKRIDWRKKMCVVIFDDRSTDKASFSQIHSVDETTTDIICIKCKRDNSESPNEIVLCDKCGIGFHQKCHSPAIPASALQLDSPWHCIYCQKSTKNPYLTESIDVMQSLFEEDVDNESVEEAPNVEEIVIKQEVFTDEEEEYSDQSFHHPTIAPPLPVKKRKGRPPMHSKENTLAKKSPTKKRPLQLLRSKFARSRLGHASACHSRKRSKHDDELNDLDVSNDANLEMEGISTTESQTLPLKYSSSISEQRGGKSIINLDESSDKGALFGQSLQNDDEKPPARKRPRSLRVSLTLPPSVETTPINPTSQHLHNQSLLRVSESELEHSMDNIKESASLNNDQTIKETISSTNIQQMGDSGNCTSNQDNSSVNTNIGMDAISSSSTTTLSSLSVNQHAPVSTVVDSSPSTSQDNPEDSLVKVSPGVTQLKPTKHKKPSITAVPVSTPSPLEQLKNELKNNRKAQTNSSSHKPTAFMISSPTTLMQSTGTITSAPPITSNLQHHHARKSAVPARAIPVSTGAVTPIQKLKQRKNSNPQSMIVVSSSPSPPKAVSIGTSHPPPLSQHVVSRMPEYNQAPEEHRTEGLNCHQAGTYSLDTRPKEPTTTSRIINMCSAPTSKQHRNRGFVFHHVQPTRAMQIQTEPLHHVNVTEAVHPRPQSLHQRNDPKYVQPQQQIHSQTIVDPKEPHIFHSELVSPDHYEKQNQVQLSHHHTQKSPYISQRVHQVTQSSPNGAQQGTNVVHLTHSHQQLHKNAQTMPQYHTAVQSANSDVMMLTPTTLSTKDGSQVYALVSTANIATQGTVMSAPMQVASHTDPVPVKASLAAAVYPTLNAPGNHRKVTYSTIPMKDTQSGVVSSNTTPCYAIMEVPMTSGQTGPHSGILQQPSISTTKPYAVVSAFPGQTNMGKKVSPPPPSPPASLKIPPSGKRSSSTIFQPEREVINDPLSKKTAQKQMQEIAQMREEATSDLTEQLQTFSHKYKDFERFTADDLMEIFHSALKKFQKSSKMYDSFSKKPVHEKIASPNVQVCPQLGNTLHLKYGSSSQQSLPKQVPSQASGAAYPPRSKYSSPVATEKPINIKPHRTYQVHTSGVFVPPPEEARAPVQTYSGHTTQQDSVHVQHQSSNASVQAGDVRRQQQNISLTEPSLSYDPKSTGTVIVHRVPSEKHRRKPEAPTNIRHLKTVSVQTPKNIEPSRNQEVVISRMPVEERRRTCAGCGKDATFLCSGCHKVWYCGRDCQVKSWDKHVNSCKS